MNFWLDFQWQYVGIAALVGFAVCELNQYLTTAVLHRGLTHGALRFSPWLTRTVAAWLWLSVCIPPLTWIAAHRHHHANSDTEDDPHSPDVKGFWHVLLFTWQDVPRWARANRELSERLYLRPFRDERLLHFLDRDDVSTWNFYSQLILSLVLGPVAIAFWLGRLVPYMLLSGYVNAAGHTFGDRPYENRGTDAAGLVQTLLGWLSGGEPLGHNFHHRHPLSANFRPGRFDPGYWFATAVLRGQPTPASDRVPAVLAREAATQAEAAERAGSIEAPARAAAAESLAEAVGYLTAADAAPGRRERRKAAKAVRRAVRASRRAVKAAKRAARAGEVAA